MHTITYPAFTTNCSIVLRYVCGVWCYVSIRYVVCCVVCVCACAYVCVIIAPSMLPIRLE